MQISQTHIFQPYFGWEGPKALEVSKLGSVGEVEKKVGQIWASLMGVEVRWIIMVKQGRSIARKKVGQLWASLMESLYVGCSMVTMGIMVMIILMLFSKF